MLSMDLSYLPVVKNALGEGLAAGATAQVTRKSKRLVYGQVPLDHKHWGAGDLGLVNDDAAPAHQYAVDAANGALRTLKKHVFCLH
jgi:hypothetical protein